MSCYTPIPAYYQAHIRTLKFVQYKCDANMEVPCGKCLGCRLDRCSDWALRCHHEAQQYDQNCFITLTFKKDPITCDVAYFQSFIKRLRSRCHYTDRPSPRYFHSTEYGDKKLRPHHHAILFNYLPPDLELFKFKKSGNLYISNELSEMWGHGFVTVGEVTHDSAAYVAAYTIKKDTSRLMFDRHTGTILAPEQMTCSREPAIGLTHFQKYYQDYYRSEFIINSKGGKQRIPRSYMKWLDKFHPELHTDLKIKREQRAFERSKLIKLDRLYSYQSLLLRQKKYTKELDTQVTTPTLISLAQFRRDYIEATL